MEKKNIIKLVIIILIIAIIISILIYIITPKPTIKHEYFTLEPQTWIENNTETDEENDIEINMFKATRGRGILEIGQEDYYINGEIESFFYYGSYKGNDFNTVYLSPLFENLSEGKTLEEQEELAKNLTIMRITNIINPKDGAINGFIIGKGENNIYSFYIFVDEDWRNKLKFTNILWGDNFKDSSTLQVKPFDFSNNEKGIYIEQLTHNIDWFKKRPREGGIIVGEVDKEVLSRLINYEPLNVTYMMVR